MIEPASEEIVAAIEAVLGAADPESRLDNHEEGVSLSVATILSLVARIRELEQEKAEYNETATRRLAEIEALRETTTRLNRRATQAEAAVLEKVRKSGPSLGRGLANAACGPLRRRVEELEGLLAPRVNASAASVRIDVAAGGGE